MPYSIDYIAQEGGIIVSWTGTVNGDEVIRSYHERYSPPERLQKLRYIISDYSEADEFNMSPEEIKTIARITSQAAAASNRKVYGVAIMPSDIEFGMARMFQSYADDELTGWRTHVTRNREDGEKWLRNQIDNKLIFKNRS